MENSYAHRLITGAEAATAVRAVLPTGSTPPTNERHIRELKTLKEEPEKMATAWTAAQERATESGTPVTAAMVKAEVAKYLPP